MKTIQLWWYQSNKQQGLRLANSPTLLVGIKVSSRQLTIQVERYAQRILHYRIQGFEHQQKLPLRWGHTCQLNPQGNTLGFLHTTLPPSWHFWILLSCLNGLYVSTCPQWSRCSCGLNSRTEINTGKRLLNAVLCIILAKGLKLVGVWVSSDDRFRTGEKH